MIGDIAHICNRGVDKRKIFGDKNDYIRFRDNLFLLNNVEGKIRTKHKNIFGNSMQLPARNKLVEILKWSLMPNHFHMLLYEVAEGGILEFTKRLGNAYTKYFNLKNNGRSGYLFQNRAKIIRAGDEKYFPYIPIYIELNPIDLIEGNTVNKIEFLESYKWGSLKNYYGQHEDEKLINKDLFYKVFETNSNLYWEDIKSFLNDREKLDELVVEGVNLAG